MYIRLFAPVSGSLLSLFTNAQDSYGIDTPRIAGICSFALLLCIDLTTL